MARKFDILYRVRNHLDEITLEGTLAAARREVRRLGGAANVTLLRQDRSAEGGYRIVESWPADEWPEAKGRL